MLYCDEGKLVRLGLIAARAAGGFLRGASKWLRCSYRYLNGKSIVVDRSVSFGTLIIISG
jgi:hypothetical protein